MLYSKMSNEEILKIMKEALENEPDMEEDDLPETEIIEILEQDINSSQFQVSTNAAELLLECYPDIFHLQDGSNPFII